MSEVYVHAVEGGSIEQKRAVVRDITDAVVRHLKVEPAAEMVQIVESARQNNAKGSVPLSDRPPG